VPIFHVALIKYFAWEITDRLPDEAVSGSTDVTLPKVNSSYFRILSTAVFLLYCWTITFVKGDLFLNRGIKNNYIIFDIETAEIHYKFRQSIHAFFTYTL